MTDTVSFEMWTAYKILIVYAQTNGIVKHLILFHSVNILYSTLQPQASSVFPMEKFIATSV